MIEQAYRCRCGARNPDEGVLADHVIDGIAEDLDGHGFVGGAEPERVTAARAEVERRQTLRARLAQVTGMSVAEIREALR